MVVRGCGVLLAWTFEEQYCQSTKAQFLYSRLKRTIWTCRCEMEWAAQIRVVKGTNINNPAAPPFFGGCHHLFSCQEELMVRRNKLIKKNKKKTNKPECFSLRMRNDAAQTSVCRCGCAALHDAAWPFNIWEWTADARCVRTWWWTPCRPSSVRFSPLGVISASSVVVCLFWSRFRALAGLFITAFPNVLI